MRALSLIPKNNLLSILIILVVFFLDRVSKNLIINDQLNNNILYINEFINLDLIWNTGIGFGLFSHNSSLIYNSITALICGVIVFLFYFIFNAKDLDKILFSFILGGALGNFYDRLIYFAVPDFIDVHYNNFHWFTFNIADIFITLGVIILISKDIIFKKKNDKN